MTEHPRHVGYVSLVIAALAAPTVIGCDSGGSSTGTGTGGSGGSGGSGGGGGGAAGSPGGSLLIDDMEDQDGSINAVDGRDGAWYTYNDETATGTQAPAVAKDFTMKAVTPARGDSGFAANTTGSGFTSWGAGMGFDLNNAGAAAKPYDASAHSGISFYARTGAGAGKGLRGNVADKQTTVEGGICKETATVHECFDDFGADVTITTEWKQVTLKFASMKQGGFAKAFPKLATNGLYAIHFQVDANVKFDLWIDDVSFVD